MNKVPPPAFVQTGPAKENQLSAMSRLLCEGFQIPADRRLNFTAEALRWKYFEPRGPWPGPRSFVAHGDNRLLAHVGVTTTEFVCPNDPHFAVSAVHPVDWLSGQRGGMLGTLLLLKALSCADAQYSLGSVQIGQSVLATFGFKALCDVAMFYKFFHPTRRAVWNLMHGRLKFPKNFAMFAVDMMRSVCHPRLGKDSPIVNLQSVPRFSNEISEVFRACRDQFICTARSPELLNYFLRSPGGKVTGWLLSRDGRLTGFALTCIVERDGIRVGSIMDCFLIETDVALWSSSIQTLTRQLMMAGCDVARAMCSAPWMRRALKTNGYFRRGGGTFLLRDPRKLVPTDRTFHLTLIEGDIGYT